MPRFDDLRPATLLASTAIAACALPHASLRQDEATPDVVSADMVVIDAPVIDTPVIDDRPVPPLDVPCPSGQMFCEGRCIDTASSLVNCGGCGVACPMNATCVSGACTCPMGQSICGGQCVNTASDRLHCGMCGRMCAANEVCAGGTCSATCAMPRMMCGASCTDVQTDAMNCGTCGRPCPAGQSCVSGACTLICAAPTTNCSNMCVNTQTDSSHCGACGRVCAGGMSCSAGSCVCAAGTTTCGTMCVDTNTSSAHCGSCGNRCGAPDGGSAGTCAAGVCGAGMCPAGSHLCSGSCVRDNAVANCGTRCAPCDPVMNAMLTCDGTNCGFNCNLGFVRMGMTCVGAPTCGNGMFDGLEACDDGNMTNGDGCSAACLIEPSIFTDACATGTGGISIRRGQIILMRSTTIGSTPGFDGGMMCNADGPDVAAAVVASEAGNLVVSVTPGPAPGDNWDVVLRAGVDACPSATCTNAGGGNRATETLTVPVTMGQRANIAIDGRGATDLGLFTLRLELRP